MFYVPWTQEGGRSDFCLYEMWIAGGPRGIQSRAEQGNGREICQWKEYARPFISIIKNR